MMEVWFEVSRNLDTRLPTVLAVASYFQQDV